MYSAGEVNGNLAQGKMVPYGARTSGPLRPRFDSEGASCTVAVRAITPQGLLVDERGRAQTVTAAGGVYRLSLPGATCRDASPCRIGGAPRLLIEQGAAVGRAALAAPPAQPVARPTAAAQTAPIVRPAVDPLWRPVRPGYLRMR